MLAAAFTLTWQTLLPTNAHAPTHFHTLHTEMCACNSVASQAPAHTQTHTDGEAVLCGLK